MWYGGTVVRLVVIERSSSKSAHVYKNTIIDGAGSAPQNNGITRDTKIVTGCRWSPEAYHRTTVPPYHLFFSMPAPRPELLVIDKWDRARASRVSPPP
jgi:hypothetical protein